MATETLDPPATRAFSRYARLSRSVQPVTEGETAWHPSQYAEDAARLDEYLSGTEAGKVVRLRGRVVHVNCAT